MHSGCEVRGALAKLAGFGPGLWLGGFLLAALAAQGETPTPVTNLWTLPLASEADATPAVGRDGMIYTGDFHGLLYAITPEGQERWRFQAGREIKSSPALAEDGTIYFGARDRQCYALTPAGKLKWKFATGAWVDSSPALAADGTICFGSWDKNFYALNPDGSLKWKFAVGGIVDSSPAIAADGTVYFGAHNKKFFALDAGGKLRWTFLTGAEVTSSPAIGEDGDVYFSSTDGNLYRLKADGTERWHCRIGGGSDGSPVLTDDGNVAIAAGQKNIFISPAGTILWSSESPCWIDETPAVALGTVCFSAPWRRLGAIQPTSTRILWEGPALQNLSSSPVITSQGRIYFCCGPYVQALQPPVALLPAKSTWPMFRANPRHTGRVGDH
jgi:outer membrane protein assembly factor BamB